MKSVFFASLLAAAALNLTSVAVRADDLQAQAKQAFSEREYDNPGIQKALKAAELYGQLAAQATETNVKAQYLVRQSEALYFVGDASTDHATKLEKHDLGYKTGDQAVKLLGVKDVTTVSDADVAKLKAMPAADLDVLAEGLYFRGVNLGKWGKENGIPSSLGKWPELRSTMELIGKLGKDETHEYGAYRTLGKAYYELPSLLGGSTKKADRYLSTAVTKTAAAGQTYSRNGYNNVYYAEVLKGAGNTAKAKELLQGFVAADPAALNSAEVPELRRAQQEAKELLKQM